jgi:hypothetical protein
MPSNLFLSNVGASTALNNLGVQFNSGFIDIYAGTQPANANTNTTGSEFILAEVSFCSAAQASLVSSTWTAQFLGATTATSTGIATFYRAITSSKVVVLDGSVSTAAADMNFNSNNFATGVSVQVTSYVLILPEH